MKKLLTISFLALLFFSQIGYYFFYLFQQHQIKEAAKHALLAKLPLSALEIIDADTHKNDIEWEEEDKEFYLHGQLFDVAYIKVVNGKTLIYCLNDSNEDEFMKRFASAVNTGQEQNSSNKDGHHTAKFQLSDFIILSNYAVAINEPVPVKYFDNSVSLITNNIEIFTPPPDLISKNKTCFL